MNESVVYRSQVRIERVKGPLRRAYVPAEQSPTVFGVHAEVAQHCGVDPGVRPLRATTLDDSVAAAAGGLTGTLGGALEARGVPAGEGRLSSQGHAPRCFTFFGVSRAKGKGREAGLRGRGLLARVRRRSTHALEHRSSGRSVP